MCGIVGYFGNYSKNTIIKETNKIKYRGPDDTKFMFKDLFGCGFVRLSIIDIEGGSQPIQNEIKSLNLICNGEIYNYKEIRTALIKKGHIFSTGSDVEVILHLYEEYGEQCINYLEGMYAFVIYDDIKKELILSRDHIGIKPLFYRIDNDNNIKFGSELKLFNLKRNKNIYSLLERDVFGFVLDTSSTIYEDIRQVPPNTLLKIKFPFLDRIHEYKANFLTSCKNVEEALFKSIETHMLSSDVDVGIALSGGLDSSLIAVMSKEIKSDIKTFTAYNKNMEDIKFARILVKKYDFDHKEIKLSFDDLDLDINDILDYSIDVSKSSTFDTIGDIVVYLFYKQISKYVKVLLSGDGGDELFGGYWMHKKPLGYKDLLLTKGNKDIIFYLNSLFPEDNGYEGKKNVLDILFYSALPNYHLLTLDRCSMRCGVEARVPYLDSNVINFVINNYSVEERQDKNILSDLYKKYLPKEILNRKKIGFPEALK